MKNTLSRASVVVAVVLSGFMYAAAAGAQTVDPLTTAVSTAQSQLLGYATLMGAAILAVALAFVAVRLIPRAVRMIASRFGG